MALTRAQKVEIGLGVLAAVAVVTAAFIQRGGNDDGSKERAKEQAASACKELADRLSDEAGLVGELKDHLQLGGGLATPKDSEFKGAWEAAHNGQAALPRAFNAYLATNHAEPTGAEIVTIGNSGVQELGNTLDAIGNGTGDEEAFSSLPDWQTKLNNTARKVSATCTS
jgi:hypothetical protein